MSRLKNKVTLFLGLMACSLGTYSQTSLSKVDLSSQYHLNPEKEIIVHWIRHEGKSTMLFAALKLPPGVENVNISFWGANSYNVPVVNLDSLILSENYLGKKEEYHHYQYQLATDYNLVAIEMATNSDEPSLIQEVYFDDKKLDIVLFSDDKFPVLSRWLNKSKSYSPNDLDISDLNIFVTHYNKKFPASSPPMSEKEADSEQIFPDSSFTTFDNSTLRFKREGFYLFQEDTSSNKGYGWRLEDEAFPRYNRIEDLIPPLRYISTPEEFQNLVDNSDKETFDKYWLKLGGNASIAKSMIRKYYTRVEYANKYFTTYKPGWKTDKGMLYIVYGTPDQVYRDEEGEVWWYDNEGEKQVFKFLRFSHVFYPDNYVLLRDNSYRLSWFKKVDRLRNNLF